MTDNLIDARKLFRARRAFVIEGDADDILKTIRDAVRDHCLQYGEPTSYRVVVRGPDAA